MRGLFKSISIVGLMLAATFVSVSSANAGWWHRHHVGYWGGYHSRWHGFYAPYIPVYRPVVFAPRVYRPYRSVYVGYGFPSISYRSYYVGRPVVSASFGCWDPCGGCYTATPCCSCYPSATSSTPVYSSQPSNMTPTPAPSAAPAPAPAPAPPVDSVLPPDPAPLPPEPADAAPALDLPPNPRDASDDLRNGAVLTLDVPEDAKVYINGLLTKTPGTQRTYVSRGLDPGYRYTYEIRAEVVRNGQPVSEQRVVELQAGQTQTLAMDLRAIQPRSIELDSTTLIVRVPSDATLSLEGAETAASGETRKFETSILKEGERWEDYRVVARIQRNGREIVQEQTLTLVGGQAQEVEFDFDASQIALR